MVARIRERDGVRTVGRVRWGVGGLVVSWWGLTGCPIFCNVVVVSVVCDRNDV